jgi:hypothetical protein
MWAVPDEADPTGDHRVLQVLAGHTLGGQHLALLELSTLSVRQTTDWMPTPVPRFGQ